MEKTKIITLDPGNPDHQRMIQSMLAVRAQPIVHPDSLVIADEKPQKVLTASDLENIRAAEEKRARKAAKLR